LFFNPQFAIRNPQFGRGAVAQLGERLVCNQEVVGSNPIGSTTEMQNEEWRMQNSGVVERASFLILHCMEGLTANAEAYGSPQAPAPAIGRDVGIFGK
jgi:hypothetical protein